MRVWRGFYWHHGIYVGDGSVVQFGGRIADKPHARIDEVPLSEFERGGRAIVVDHSDLRWPIARWKLPDPYPPERIVARARCLAAHGIGVYNLVGRNCETLWCVCGMGESLQRQWFQFVNAYLIGVPLSFHTLRLNRDGRRIRVLVWSALALRWWLLVMYYWHNRRFYQDVRTCDI